MSPSERLRELALNSLQVWYPAVFDREAEEQDHREMYEILAEADPMVYHRIGTIEYRIEHVSEDNVFVTYRHLDEV